MPSELTIVSRIFKDRNVNLADDMTLMFFSAMDFQVETGRNPGSTESNIRVGTSAV
jgi:hypothetical protein